MAPANPCRGKRPRCSASCVSWIHAWTLDTQMSPWRWLQGAHDSPSWSANRCNVYRCDYYPADLDFVEQWAEAFTYKLLIRSRVNMNWGQSFSSFAILWPISMSVSCSRYSKGKRDAQKRSELWKQLLSLSPLQRRTSLLVAHWSLFSDKAMHVGPDRTIVIGFLQCWINTYSTKLLRSSFVLALSSSFSLRNF